MAARDQNDFRASGRLRHTSVGASQGRKSNGLTSLRSSNLTNKGFWPDLARSGQSIPAQIHCGSSPPCRLVSRVLSLPLLSINILSMPHASDLNDL